MPAPLACPWEKWIVHCSTLGTSSMFWRILTQIILCCTFVLISHSTWLHVTTRNLAFCDNKKSSLKTKKSSLYEYSDDFFHCHIVGTDSMSQIDPCDNPLKVVTKFCYSMTRTKSSLMIIILWQFFLSLFHIFFCHKCSKSHHKFEVYSDDLNLSLSILVFSDKNSRHLVNLHVSDNL